MPLLVHKVLVACRGKWVPAAAAWSQPIIGICQRWAGGESLRSGSVLRGWAVDDTLYVRIFWQHAARLSFCVLNIFVHMQTDINQSCAGRTATELHFLDVTVSE